MNKKRLVLLGLISLLALSCTVLAQTEEDVGDLASFGKEAKFFGYAQTGVVLLSRDCSTVGFPLGPDDRCLTINATTSSVSFDVRNIGRITFPRKTFQNIIYLQSRHQIVYTFFNATTLTKSGRLQYRPYITLVSSVLDDPSLINPQTGQPFNGRMDISHAGGRSFAKTLFPGYQENDFLTYGSPSIGGITRKFIMDTYGLSQAVVDDLFDEKIIMQLNIRGSATHVEEGSFAWGTRFIGN